MKFDSSVSKSEHSLNEGDEIDDYFSKQRAFLTYIYLRVRLDRDLAGFVSADPGHSLISLGAVAGVNLPKVSPLPTTP